MQLLDDRVARVEQFQYVLRVIRRDHVVPGLALPSIKWQNTREYLQHRRLACTVRPDQRRTITARKRQVNTFVDHVVPVRLADVRERYGLRTSARWFRERVADLLGGARQLDDLDLFKLLQSALHLTRLGCLVTKTLHKAHLLLHLTLLPCRGRTFDLKNALTRN